MPSDPPRDKESTRYYKENRKSWKKDYKLHNTCIISRQIVNRALEANALIVLGDIKHLRGRKQSKNMGRKFNRKLARFQYYRLTQYIKYKAALAGI